ncbi:caspase-7-like [Octopus bimaculoides]|uniref:Caspase family p20 domain-containing protein n=1 Tax=Octopus bimaculoides TaxID=37653 RepID=A0A0L8G3C5_OCTBM|nr:caspase-7-like [Octopus bimaculoides]
MTALEKSKHIKIFDLLDEQTVYPMKFKPHGRVILINNVKFDDAKYPERLGSEKDVEGITKLFTAFNFDVQLYSNKTAEEMEDVILKEAAESTAREDCFVMFLMSHGVLGNIVGTDGEKLPYSTINTILQDSSQLKNKPKLIYVNACEANSDKEGKDGYFDAPDLYVFFSTVPGRLSYRTRDKGSYFIESLISVYERNKERCDIFALSDQIISQVSKKNEENSKEIYQNYEEFAQIPSGSHKLTKKVILRTTD